MSNTKPSNPKDLVGSKKLDLGNVPDSAMIALAQAFFEGAVKYGRYNWRIAGVSASTYHAALKRHVSKWWNGQNKDPETRVHHLANAMACLAILFDAELYNMLTDDRPPCPDPDAMARAIDEAAATVEHLRQLFKAHNPKQYTIADTDRRESVRNAIADQRPEWVDPSPPLPSGIKHCVEVGCTKPAVQGFVRCGPHAAAHGRSTVLDRVAEIVAAIPDAYEQYRAAELASAPKDPLPACLYSSNTCHEPAVHGGPYCRKHSVAI